MARTKANGEGSIYQRKDGYWVASLTIGRNPLTGKLKRKTFSGKTKKEVLDKLKQFNKIADYVDLSKDDITLSQWFKIWLFEYKKMELKTRSFQRYEGIYRTYIKDSVAGGTKLSKLKPAQLQNLINNLGTSKSNARYIHTILKSALTLAVKQDYIVKNPALAVIPPKPEKNNKKKTLTREEQTKIIDYLTINIDDNLNFMILFDLFTGLRLGEIMALEWSDLDITEKTLAVNKTYSKKAVYSNDNILTGYERGFANTKNEVAREVPIPNILIPKLKTMYTTFLKDKLLDSKKYKSKQLIFSSNGEFIYDKKPLREVKKIYKELGFSEELNFHSLRHSYATRLFEQNIAIKTIQNLLGHIDIATTIETYVHVSENIKKEAVESLNNLYTTNIL
ncbi:tyrosine-type recombinase/integrase [Clostridium algidicarnis]|uniref:tyrosine-type recombinase/integrase n=1 Tax=Clostridium algidicarnis TaxID=37659 RepID=UPI001C0BC5CF|nr:site-specific integrase [Clostridium algidicarnis]MBU3205189.1 site-specific integrase [Clostridium algidicarnis]MBU3213342.1 site-specific integrase [Clostridium algidicarnis]MBU3223763.1 site-specific integrase [Clostridium algidicarnis]